LSENSKKIKEQYKIPLFLLFNTPAILIFVSFIHFNLTYSIDPQNVEQILEKCFTLLRNMLIALSIGITIFAIGIWCIERKIELLDLKMEET